MMRNKIGEYAIKAITEFGYDGIIIEVNDFSAASKCDADQAMLSSPNIDWSKTYVRKEPSMKPITLADIVAEIISHLASDSDQLKDDQERLRSLKF